MARRAGAHLGEPPAPGGRTGYRKEFGQAGDASEPLRPGRRDLPQGAGLERRRRRRAVLAGPVRSRGGPRRIRHRAVAAGGGPAGATGELRGPAGDAGSPPASRSALAWFRPELADAAPLRLEPLAEHHAESLYFQYRDPQIAAMAMLPAMATLEQARSWIAGRTAAPGAMCCAVRHENWGLVGMVGLQAAADSAVLTLWMGADHQGRGYGPLAAAALIRLGQAAGLRQIFAAAFGWAPRSSRVLADIGLERLAWTAAQPHNDLSFFRLGAEKNEQQMHAEFGALCRAINSPYQLDALAVADTE
ncbi:GNAT family N-acetyltransferase [Rugamonas sp. DEMB1]|uniref:GNAT family N-acetyltransferase n=1 Tax=Rugamonas sp. DEMB1 TaxID=3039386 RepID=UPI00244CE71E|nr:GNAT family N-acetyltransferase [Rugamonas sp. DEMB1]WGG53579.1 GNAT family N-acetyltransferase [Rugamonas sp. DEMB1]